MHNPLDTIETAKKEVARNIALREGYQLEFRGAFAAEKIADEMTLMRAEMSVIRELLATIAAKR